MRYETTDGTMVEDVYVAAITTSDLGASVEIRDVHEIYYLDDDATIYGWDVGPWRETLPVGPDSPGAVATLDQLEEALVAAGYTRATQWSEPRRRAHDGSVRYIAGATVRADH